MKSKLFIHIFTICFLSLTPLLDAYADGVGTIGGDIGIRTAEPTAALDINSDTIRIRTKRTPNDAGADCAQGEIAWDSNFLYICVAQDTWKRALFSTWIF